MKTRPIILTNNIHNTRVVLRARNMGGDLCHLSIGQVRRSRRVLCGMSGCHCGGDLGERGWQEVHIELQSDGSAILWENDGGQA